MGWELGGRWKGMGMGVGWEVGGMGMGVGVGWEVGSMGMRVG